LWGPCSALPTEKLTFLLVLGSVDFATGKARDGRYPTVVVPYFVTPLLPDLRKFYGRFLVNKNAAMTPPVGSVSFGFNMAKSGVKPLIFLITVSVTAWVAGMAIHGF
jgi:hypothetical protein